MVLRAINGVARSMVLRTVNGVARGQECFRARSAAAGRASFAEVWFRCGRRLQRVANDAEFLHAVPQGVGMESQEGSCPASSAHAEMATAQRLDDMSPLHAV